MAMSETTPSPTDWVQLYQHTLSGQSQSNPIIFTGGHVSDATVVTTTVTSPTIPSPQGQGSLSTNPDGRISKPVRRRSRASRRTPTTVLNTDTTNFRAMVQQFTGGPPIGAPYATISAGTPQFSNNFDFASPNPQSLTNPHATLAQRGYPPQQQLQNRQTYQHLHQQLMFSPPSNPHHQADAAALFQRSAAGRSRDHQVVSHQDQDHDDHHGFMVEGLNVVSSQLTRARRSSSDENESENNYNML